MPEVTQLVRGLDSNPSSIPSNPMLFYHPILCVKNGITVMGCLMNNKARRIRGPDSTPSLSFRRMSLQRVLLWLGKRLTPTARC